MTALAEDPTVQEQRFHENPDGETRHQDLPRVRGVLKQFRVVDTDYRAKGVRRLAAIFRQAYGLPEPTEADFERATCWKATVFQGRVIAVFGEKWYSERVMEISDAYSEPTRYGRLAVYSQALWYKGRVDEGLLDEATFMVLGENKSAIAAVVRETKQLPWALIWRYHRA